MLMTATTMTSSMRVKPAWPTGRRLAPLHIVHRETSFLDHGNMQEKWWTPRREPERRCTNSADSARARAWCPPTPSGVVHRPRGPKISAEHSLPAMAVGIVRLWVVSSWHRGDVDLSTYRQPISR